MESQGRRVPPTDRVPRGVSGGQKVENPLPDEQKRPVNVGVLALEGTETVLVYDWTPSQLSTVDSRSLLFVLTRRGLQRHGTRVVPGVSVSPRRVEEETFRFQ